MKRRILAGAFAGLTILGLAAVAGHAQSADARPAPLKAEDVYKNIRILKGVPADHMRPTMDFMATSLGVACPFCHVQGALDKEDKPMKQKAREMIQLVFDINKNNFSGSTAVTCFTCHHGSTKVAGTPVITDDRKPVMPAATSPSADQIIDKYLTALGGEDAIRKISSRIEMGAVTDAAGHSVPLEVFDKTPEMRLVVIHRAKDDVTVFHGNVGWLVAPGPGERDMDPVDLDGAKLEGDLYLASHFKQAFPKLSALPPEMIAGRQVYVLSGSGQGMPRVQFFFDKDSGLLTRLVYYSNTIFGQFATQIDYADYRDIDGVKAPYRWTIAKFGGPNTYQVEQLQQNVPVDDAKFEKPTVSGASAEGVPPR